jgi:hypothetical protein
MAISNPPPASPLTMESLLQLANFVARPDYVDKLRELKDATHDHNQAAEVAQKTLETSITAQKQLAADKKAHEKAVAEHEAAAQAMMQRRTAADRDLRDRQAALKVREEEHSAHVDRVGKDIFDRTSKLSEKERELIGREAAVKQREDAADKRHADLQRRAAKVKEAMS